jgi:hypothetical protein
MPRPLLLNPCVLITLDLVIVSLVAVHLALDLVASSEEAAPSSNFTAASLLAAFFF